jgi:hypothetical protein
MSGSPPADVLGPAERSGEAAGRLGMASAVTFTVAVLALEVTETASAGSRPGSDGPNEVGLASLSSAVALEGSRRVRIARWLFALSGLSMLVLLTGFVVSSPVAQLAGAIWGWFLTLPAAGILTVLVFRRGVPHRRFSVPSRAAPHGATR